jgi:oxygen-dependent protoporphyrinogen oxidase
VILATPTNVAGQLVAGFSSEWASLFSRIEYAPVAVISAGYRREQFQEPPAGFGFLVPRAERLHVLGTVFNSSLFSGRAPEGIISLTSFAGGATNPQFCELPPAEITAAICAEVATVLGISGDPVATELQVYPRAIPQYNLGHGATVAALAKLTSATPELFLTGNYLSGPSIGACAEQATRTAQEIRIYLASIGVAGVGAVAHA